MVKVASFIESYPIFCIGSRHDITTAYTWELYGSTDMFPETPVLYTARPGLYQCTVKHGAERAESKVIKIDICSGEVFSLLNFQL